jgi:hypothetical protein
MLKTGFNNGIACLADLSRCIYGWFRFGRFHCSGFSIDRGEDFFTLFEEVI